MLALGRVIRKWKVGPWKEGEGAENRGFGCPVDRLGVLFEVRGFAGGFRGVLQA